MVDLTVKVYFVLLHGLASHLSPLVIILVVEDANAVSLLCIILTLSLSKEILILLIHIHLLE